MSESVVFEIGQLRCVSVASIGYRVGRAWTQNGTLASAQIRRLTTERRGETHGDG